MTHQKGVQAVGQLHTAMNQVGQSQTASLRLRIPVILTMIGSLQIQFMHGKARPTEFIVARANFFEN